MSQESQTIPFSPELVDEVLKRLDLCLSLQGDDVNMAGAMEAARKELGHGDFAAWPTKKGEQVKFVTDLADAVLASLGQPQAAAPRAGGGVVKEGWDDSGNGPPIIRHPLGS